MRITVNGVEVPIQGRFEVVFELDDGGEMLPAGALITIRGGALQLHGREGGPGLTILGDESLEIYERHGNPGLHVGRTSYLPGEIVVESSWPGDSLTPEEKHRTRGKKLTWQTVDCSEEMP